MTDSKPPRPLTLVLVALLLAAGGLFMILHGLGLADATWLHPNPRTPAWVFSATGLFLLLGGILTVNQLRPLPLRMVNVIGWSAIAIGMVMANWLVFFADGASCGVETGGYVFQGLGLACRGFAAIIVLLFDVVLLAVALTRKSSSGARS